MRKAIPVLLISVTTIGFCALALSDAGGKQNPLVSKSYIDQNVVSYVNESVRKSVNEGMTAATDRQMKEINGVRNQYVISDSKTALAAIVADMLVPDDKTLREDISIQCDEITGGVGSSVVFTTGSAKITGAVIDLSTGQEIPAGNTALLNHKYAFGENLRGKIEIISSSARFISSGPVTTGPKRPAIYSDYADKLNKLGLFKGTPTGYELTRPASRGETIVMLIRLLGQEKQALSYAGVPHPFTDVPSWLSPYVSYAYAHRYTSGVTKTLFGSKDQTTKDQFFTFILRSLLYDDRIGDFDYYKSAEFACNLGLLSSYELDELNLSGMLYRDHMVYVIFNVLDTKLKLSGDKLSDRLVANGIFTKDAYVNVKNH